MDPTTSVLVTATHVTSAMEDVTSAMEDDSTQDEHTTAMNSKEQDLLSRYQRQVQRLEKEISELEGLLDLERKKSFGTDEDFKMWIRSRQTENLSKEIVASEIKNLEEMIQLNEKITGIQFTTTNWTPVKQEGMVLTRRHFMEGFCCEKTFQLTYDIEEDFSQSDQGMALTDLTLYVEDDIGAAISNHLEQLTETDDINIQGFFTMLPSYLAWKREQDEAITGLLQEYSEFVEHRHQDNVHTLVISNPNINRPSFVLDWDFKVDHFKKIERDFQLAVKVPHKMLNHDNHKVLASTPEMFMKVLKKAGPKNAVTMLVKMVSGQADTQD